MGRIAFYVLACAAFGASAGFVLWWVGVPVAGASLLGVVAACVLALVLVLAAALQGRW
jgi:ABC-type proline/glycine betaine transport system permease subunit